jgi:hypothetical protein
VDRKDADVYAGGRLSVAATTLGERGIPARLFVRVSRVPSINWTGALIWCHRSAVITVSLTDMLMQILMRSGTGFTVTPFADLSRVPGEASAASFGRYLTFVGADREQPCRAPRAPVSFCARVAYWAPVGGRST